MVVDPLRVAEHIHGHAGWLAAALLVHPAVVLRNRQRRAHLAVGLATALVTVVAAVGAVLYVSYRELLRADIFRGAPAIGLAFERKEHLAFGCVALAWAGAAAYFAAPRASEGTKEALRTFAFRAFVGAAALAILVALLGTLVASYRSF